MIEKTEFLANKINEFIEKYGEVPPHWIFKPDSHPYSIFGDKEVVTNLVTVFIFGLKKT